MASSLERLPNEGNIGKTPVPHVHSGPHSVSDSLSGCLSVVCVGTSRALGISNELFVLGDSVILTVLGQVAFMPVLVLAAQLCPEVITCLTARPFDCSPAHLPSR